MKIFELHAEPAQDRHMGRAIKKKSHKKYRKYAKCVICGIFLLFAFSVTMNIFYDRWFSNGKLGIKYSIFRSLPLRTYSRLQGSMCMIRYPWPANILVVGLMKTVMQISLEDAEKENISDYASVNDLFTRKIKKSSRPLGAGLVSPADGTIIYAGLAAHSTECKIKGVHYEIEELLLDSTVISDVKENHEVFQIVIYLAPHNYHRFHSFCDFTLTRILHVPSLLFSVGGLSMRYFPGLLSKNERVIFLGEYEHGRCYTVAVGSLGVGSISTPVATFQTNRIMCLHSDPIEVFRETRKYAKGEELGHFNLGSTVVLVFSAPKNFVIHRQSGSIRMGETFGSFEPIDSLSNPR